MLPATKAIPKEMLPIVDKPIIQYVVEEAEEAGFEEVILITHSSKTSVENHFDTSFELEATLNKRIKRSLLLEIKAISSLKIIFTVLILLGSLVATSSMSIPPWSLEIKAILELALSIRQDK